MVLEEITEKENEVAFYNIDERTSMISYSSLIERER